MMSYLKWLNLALRGLMETGIVIALGHWGFVMGQSGLTKLLLAVGVPLVGFGFWGLVDFRRSGRMAEPLRLMQELFISGIAAAAWYAAGQSALAWILALISIIHHLLVYGLGMKLLKTDP